MIAGTIAVGINSSAFIITLTGPSMSGKSYVMEKILEAQNELAKLNLHFVPVPFPKYTTRAYRIGEISARKNKQYVDVQSVDEIPKSCDLVYQTYGKEYGLKTSELQELLEAGKCPVVVINDVRAVEELKRRFPEQVASLFLFRRIPSLGDYKKGSEERGNISKREYQDRYDKAVAMYRMYIENINLFTKVILNVKNFEGKKGEEDYTKLQVTNTIKGVLRKQIHLGKITRKEPKIFIISGNPSSGKDEVIKAVEKMGKLQAKILPKYTSRRQAADDGDEMVCKHVPKADLIAMHKNTFALAHDNVSEKYAQEYDVDFVESCAKEYRKAKRKEDFEGFCAVNWEINKLNELRRLRKPNELFWNAVKDDLSKTSENEILGYYFEKNEKYVDLEQIGYESKQKRIKQNSEEYCELIVHQGKQYVIYQNNKNIKYGFLLENLKADMDKDKLHRVLVASLVGIFNICRKRLGNKRVVTIYAYSQIAQDEYENNTDSTMVDIKKSHYDDFMRYCSNIIDFNHVIIYAETKMDNESGGQKEELIDQMFRLFRAY